MFQCELVKAKGSQPVCPVCLQHIVPQLKVSTYRTRRQRRRGAAHEPERVMGRPPGHQTAPGGRRVDPAMGRLAGVSGEETAIPPPDQARVHLQQHTGVLSEEKGNPAARPSEGTPQISTQV